MDTGFNGFLMMPHVHALQIGLTGRTTTDLIFPDGSKRTGLMAEGQAALDHRVEAGLIIVDEACTEVLAGMPFLRAFDLTLVLNSNLFVMMDTPEVGAGR